MIRVKAFIVAILIGGCTLVVLALLFGAGEGGVTLFNLGVVIMLASAGVGMSDRIVRYLGGGDR